MSPRIDSLYSTVDDQILNQSSTAKFDKRDIIQIRT